jgi:carboxymethylenebutenolidase
MGDTIQLKADDGHVLSTYVAEGSPGGSGLVILHEIFGVNRHIRAVADRYAREGFWTVAPALFDRVQKDVELEYTPENSQAGKDIAARLDQVNILKDIAAALDFARSRSASGKAGVVGYCLGGTYAWLSATRLKPDAAVGYYGSRVIDYVGEPTVAPVILHFGRQDRAIPVATVEKIQAARPEIPVYLYDAGHGFNCDERASYSEPDAHLALSRSLEFLRENLGS